MPVRELQSPPSLSLLYPRALAGATVVPVLRGVPGLGRLFAHGEGLPDLELRVSEVSADSERVASYARVCGLSLRNELPATYPHVLSFPLSMQLMTDTAFPFAVLGLVHIRNRIKQLRPVAIGERLALAVRAQGLSSHRRGTQFDLVAEASVDGETVWREQSTYLRTHTSGNGSSTESESAKDPHPPSSATIWNVPSDVGRRYAKVSGDTNPIHLHPLTARLFGLPRAIAHGMWLKARCLAGLEGMLSESFDIDVQFRRPVYLPAQVSFSCRSDADERTFALKSAATGKTHLTGTATNG